jgi:hypothetical protein
MFSGFPAQSGKLNIAILSQSMYEEFMTDNAGMVIRFFGGAGDRNT